MVKVRLWESEFENQSLGLYSVGAEAMILGLRDGVDVGQDKT
jgi:hypothetical protein